MPDPLQKTFDLLAATRIQVAVDLLVRAVDSQHPDIRDRAVAALLKRGTPRCQTEVIRRLSVLSAAARKNLDDQGIRLSATIRQCLLFGDEDLRANGLTIVVTTECFDQVPTLLQILEEGRDAFRESALVALQDLVNHLYEQTRGGDARKPAVRFKRNLTQARQSVLGALEAACNRFDRLMHGEQIVECALILGDPDNFAIRKILSQGAPACRDTASRLLLTSKHPGVLRLLVEFMGQNYPHPKAAEAFEKRNDPEFICHLLRTFPKRLTENHVKNFKQLTQIPWLIAKPLELDMVPRTSHEALATFAQASGISDEAKSELQQWLLRNGSVAGRQAASRALESLEPEAARGILVSSLESEEEEVQAWATSQLRVAGIPEAIGLLVSRLDSPLPAVRGAARGELESFNLELVLNIFDHLDRSVALRAAGLLRKIDPDCTQKLLDEFDSPIRRRRIRAARAASALGFAADVQPGLFAMLKDEDTLVRRTGAEALSAVPTAEVVAALVELLSDPSPRVRESVEQSLDRIQRSGPLQNGLTSPPPAPRSGTKKGAP